MGYEDFPEAPKLAEHYEAAQAATEPLDVQVDVAMAPIMSGSHKPVLDQQGNPVSGGIKPG